MSPPPPPTQPPGRERTDGAPAALALALLSFASSLFLLSLARDLSHSAAPLFGLLLVPVALLGAGLGGLSALDPRRALVHARAAAILFAPATLLAHALDAGLARGPSGGGALWMLVLSIPVTLFPFALTGVVAVFGCSRGGGSRGPVAIFLGAAAGAALAPPLAALLTVPGSVAAAGALGTLAGILLLRDPAAARGVTPRARWITGAVVLLILILPAAVATDAPGPSTTTTPPRLPLAVRMVESALPTVARTLVLGRGAEEFGLRGSEAAAEHPRGFLARSHDAWDRIVIPCQTRPGAADEGLWGGVEDFLHTVEALHAALVRLEPSGLLLMECPLDGAGHAPLRLLATATEALARSGASDPRDRVLLFQEGTVALLMAGRTPLPRASIERLAEVAAAAGAVPVYLPGIPAESVFHRYMVSGNRRAFLEAFPRSIVPATDDRPFFFEPLTPRTLAHTLLGVEGAPAATGGVYVALALALSLALGLASLLPLRRFRRAGSEAVQRPAALVTLALLGAGSLTLAFALSRDLALQVEELGLLGNLFLPTVLLAAALGLAHAWRAPALRVPPPLAAAGLAAVLAIFLPAESRFLLGEGPVFRLLLAGIVVASAGYPLGLACGEVLRRARASGPAGLSVLLWGAGAGAALGLFLPISWGFAGTLWAASAILISSLLVRALTWPVSATSAI